MSALLGQAAEHSPRPDCGHISVYNTGALNRVSEDWRTQKDNSFNTKSSLFSNKGNRDNLSLSSGRGITRDIISKDVRFPLVVPVKQ